MTTTTTVVITNYNQGSQVLAAVRSAVRQSCPARVIVVDDGSTDESDQHYRHLPSHVELVRQNNCGVVFARNRALKMVDTTHVVFLDADDTLHRDFIRLTSFAYRLSRPLPAVVYTAARLRSPSGKPLGYFDPGYWDREHLARRNRALNTALFSVAALRNIGGYDPRFNRLAFEDWDLMLRLVDAGYDGRRVLLPLVDVCISPGSRNRTFDQDSVYRALRQAHRWIDIGSPDPPHDLGLRLASGTWRAVRAVDSLLSVRPSAVDEGFSSRFSFSDIKRDRRREK